MTLKKIFILLVLGFIIFADRPVSAQDKYKIYLTNGRSIACTKYWYEGEQILLTTTSGITFGFEKQEVVKIEGAEETGPKPAELSPTPLASPPTTPAHPVSPPAPKPQAPSAPLPSPSPPLAAPPPPSPPASPPSVNKSSPEEPEIILDEIREDKSGPDSTEEL